MVAVSAFQRDEIRPIDADDLEAILAIDRVHTKYSRRRFFEKRLAQAAAHPAEFVQIGFARGGSLRGLRSSIFYAANSAATIRLRCSMH